MKCYIFLILFISNACWAEGLKKENLNNQVMGGGEQQALNVEQIQQLMKSHNVDSTRQPAANESELRELMEQVKELNVQVKERNKALEHLMKEP